MMPEVEHPPHEHLHPRGPRLRDWILPICALFISVVSLAVAINHGRAMERMAEENARLVQANSWPFLQYVTSIQDNGAGDQVISLGVHDAGVGPAKVESFEVFWQGQPVRNSVELLERCCGLDPATLQTGGSVSLDGASQRLVIAAQQASRARIASNFIAASATGVMEARQQANFLALPLTEKTAQAWTKLNAARFEVQTRACYCSVFDECWISNLRTLSPEEVKRCPTPKVPFGG